MPRNPWLRDRIGEKARLQAALVECQRDKEEAREAHERLGCGHSLIRI